MFFFHDRGQATTTYDMKSFVFVLVRFVVIFGINTTSDISKWSYVMEKAVVRGHLLRSWL